MESVAQADYCVLVTEPTAFGLHTLRMVQELVTLLEMCIRDRSHLGHVPL